MSQGPEMWINNPGDDDSYPGDSDGGSGNGSGRGGSGGRGPGRGGMRWITISHRF